MAPAFSNDIYEEITKAIQSGDSKKVSSYFGSSIDITLLNEEAIYSKVQGEQILKDFFLKNPPKTFHLLHKGSSKESILYGIGKLETKDGKKFRISFFMKNNAGNYTIQELRCEVE